MDPKDRLYQLLPAIHRIRDAENGYRLRALLRVIEEQADVLEDDISQLYENWFIETCEEWAVPYIGDLVGYLPLHSTGAVGGKGSPRDLDRTRILIPRRDVANTIRYRRRKGTLALLELLSEDVADWPARAVEFYRLLGWTQALDHQHKNRGGTVDIGDVGPLERIDGPFDSVPHTVDVRRIVSGRDVGRYNIPSVGVFACRLRSYPVTRTMAYHVDTIGPRKTASPTNYTFSVLGNDTPLFTLPEREADPHHIADEIDLPVQIRRGALEDRGEMKRDKKHFRASEAYYGPEKSLAIWVAGWPPIKDPAKGALSLVPAEHVIPADLSEWSYHVPKDRVAVDPVLGRIKFPASQNNPTNVYVRYHYGFSADIGGGEYSRPMAGPDPVAVSRVRAADLRDPVQFASRVAAAECDGDPISFYIKGRLSEATLYELKAGLPTMTALLAADLDALLSDEGFYDPERFRNVDLSSAELTGLLTQGTEAGRVIRRNRLLLEATYPDLLPTSYRMYRVGEREEHKRINDALAAWKRDVPSHAVIEIADNGIYVEPISIHLEPGQSLCLRAANAKRPVIRQLNWQTGGPDSVGISGEEGSRMVLDGLLITGRGVSVNGPSLSDEFHANREDLCELVVRHCTLVPGWSIDSESCPEHGNEPSIELINTRSQLRIEKSIIGAIMVAARNIRSEPNRILMKDSIVDATGTELDAIGTLGGLIAHAVLCCERCTVLGKVSTHSIKLAQDSIFTGTVKVARTQAGCMRFSYVPFGSRTPRRFRCMPDILTVVVPDEDKEAVGTKTVPCFSSTLFGTPSYCQLGNGCPERIREGAEDGSEMGVFHDLYQPQREANLRLRLGEYTPTGMEAGIRFVN